MTNNYYNKHKEKLQKEACERYKNLSEEKKRQKVKKGSRHIEIFLQKKKKKSVSINTNVIRIFLMNKSNVYMRNYYLAHKK